jgi:hypothetical protein
MTTLRKANGLPLVWAFVVWFVHFMLCWVAVELWPGQWQANVLAWAATAVALLVLGWHWLRLQRPRAPGPLSGWVQRLALGSTALAGVAVVFSALPSFVFLP